ncbi:hypothetical protein C1645_739309 [Glomus cerebriforme]|uniref:Uncharacterized protein n=1 Tax=Glomus cerebriforme TaxID=658196 RepID=A0A397SXK9_9GLOM|nr:hypothetical protein C1645_739309 [Glomus cerebriforme]
MRFFNMKKLYPALITLLFGFLYKESNNRRVRVRCLKGKLTTEEFIGLTSRLSHIDFHSLQEKISKLLGFSKRKLDKSELSELKEIKLILEKVYKQVFEADRENSARKDRKDLGKLNCLLGKLQIIKDGIESCFAQSAENKNEYELKLVNIQAEIFRKQQAINANQTKIDNNQKTTRGMQVDIEQNNSEIKNIKPILEIRENYINILSGLGYIGKVGIVIGGAISDFISEIEQLSQMVDYKYDISDLNNAINFVKILQSNWKREEKINNAIEKLQNEAEKQNSLARNSSVLQEIILQAQGKTNSDPLTH